MALRNSKWILLLTFSSFVIFDKSFSQNKIIYKEEESTYAGNYYVSKIIFVDSISGHKKSFNVLEKNPFNNYPFKILTKNHEGNNVYQLSSAEVNKIIPMAFRAGYNEGRRDFKGNNIEKFYGTSYTGVYKKSQGYSVITYTFGVGEEDYTVGVLGSIIVFDKSGTCIYEDKIVGVNINKAVITQNGRFLCYTYGGDVDEDGSIITAGYRIIDLMTQKIIIDRQNPTLGGPFVVHNLIVNGYDTLVDRQKYVYVVFDPEQKCLYTKDYYFEETSYLSEITYKGFWFLTKNNRLTFDSFEEKFAKEIIQ